jgi:tetratricopeptide (TPR) repeat protein
MSIVFRWRPGLLLVLLALFFQPVARAQTSAPDGSAPDVSAAANDAGVILSSGAGQADATTQPAEATQDPSNAALLGQGPPQQAVAARPDPTPDQLSALRTLEAEVNGFLERGGGFRRSVNGLLAREHERQLDRVRQSFDRQIQAERASEAEARRHAIQVFERFLEIYPEDAERTPDVMFRLAELYFDEAAYAKLDADERMDRLVAERRAQGLSADDLISPPVDYRCSILLYRHIISRFQGFRLRDATHYLLGWVIKEMGHEDEAISSYKGLVCPSRFHYESERGFDLMAPLQPADAPVACGHLFDVLRPRAPELISPPATMADADAGDGGADAAMDPQVAAALAAPVDPTATASIPRDYADCEPLRGANNQPSRYAGETWYYIGDYHFDTARDDQGNAIAIAAYQASMHASERRRATTTRPGQPAAGIQGANETANQVQTSAAARAQFDAQLEYGAFWSKSLYKVGWAYFRMQNGYPQALRSFSYLLDYYDFVGAEAAAQGNRSDTIKWIGVIFSESEWGLGVSPEDSQRCQQIVENVARPPTEATRPFDCAGIMRIASPMDAAQVMARRGASTADRPQPIPGRPSYIPQDRAWTPEAYLELANDYFQQTKYYEAITLYRMFLELYPLHFQAPRVAEGIAIAYERQRQFDAAIAARGRLAQYIEGTAWWAANPDHPDAQRYAEQVARNSLHDTAIQHHQTAGRLRQEALNFVGQARRATGAQQAELQARAVDALRRADAEYAAAVQAYTQFIDNYPNDEAAYEFRYNRGDALFWSKSYLEAARAYAVVRDSNENDQYLVASAYMVVKSLELHIRTQAQARQMDACTAIRAGIRRDELTDDVGNPLLPEAQATACTQPPATGTTVNELEIPDLVRQLMEARITYANRVPQNLDNESALRDVVQVDNEHPENNPPYRAKFAYLNARTLLRFGHAREAEQLLRGILTRYCGDPTVAAAAVADLNNLLVLQGRQDELEQLATEQLRNPCAGVSADSRTGFEGIITGGVFRRALDVYRRAERAPASESGALYEQAARDMEEAVRRNRGHDQAPLALFYTATAYERTNRFDTATQTYIRITQDYNNTRNAAGRELEGEDLTQRVNILEQSNFRAAINLERTFDYDNAIRYYNNVVSDQRLSAATDHDAHVHDALASIALITTNLGRWQPARAAWQNFLPRAAAGRERSEAEFRIAEIPYRSNDWAEAVRSLQDYLRRVPATGDNAQYRVQAQYNIALAHQRMNSDVQYRRALREVVTVFRSAGGQPGTTAAAWAAEALYRDLDDQVVTFLRNQFQRGDATSLRQQITRFKDQLRAIDASARDIIALRGGEYSIGALTRQGEAHEYLATQEARLGELIELSREERAQFARAEQAIARLESLATRIERANADQAEQLRARAQQLRDQLQQQQDDRRQRVQTAFDEESQAERQLGIINFGTAVHTARSQNIPTPFASRALERMRTEENRALLDQALGRQQVFPYTAGMFNTEAPGATLSQTTPIATPGIVAE